jgi:hypothetical protein
VTKKRVKSRELGESFIVALTTTEPVKVREVVRDWAADNRDALHDLIVEGLDWQADIWEQRIEEKGLEDAERRYQGMLTKLDNNLYDLVLEIVATQAKGEDGQNIRRHPVEVPKQKASAGDGDDWDYGDEDGGRSSNDDRSDSMNPNNDSYQASADNRSDQMNPNNDAYRG